MFKVIIADDDEDMCLVLSKALGKMEDVSVVAQAHDANEAVEQFQLHRPDAVFLDVEMGDTTGLDAAKIIVDIDPKCMIVFVTAFQEYMPQAFEVYAFDYIVKPFKIARLEETIRRMRMLKLNTWEHEEKTDAEIESIWIKDKEGMSIVDPKDIILIQRENRSTIIITKKGRYHTSETLSQIEAKLSPVNFIRSHKSYIIQVSKIVRIEAFGRWTYLVKLKDIQEDALLTREKAEVIELRFKIKFEG